MSASKLSTMSLKARLDYPGFTLEVDRELELDRVVGLFGASGCGKSTLLRTIAGFERGAIGRLEFDGECWQDTATRKFVAPYRRPVGFVFQDTRLFRHCDVAGNLEFAARRGRSNRGAIGQEEVVAAFDLHALMPRSVDDLSGGERQRVAIARTLLTQPRLLLLDEPLAALDRGRKGEILPYLESLPERFGVPIIYVSHAVDEIARLCDRVIAMDAGRISAVGSAADVLNHLHDDVPDADQVTVIEARVVKQLPDVLLTQLDHAGHSFVVPMLTHLPAGSMVRLSVRATDVAIATEAPRALSFRNVLRGTLVSIHPHPDSPFATVTVDIGGTALKARLTRHAAGELDLRDGMPVFALLKTASFDRQA